MKAANFTTRFTAGKPIKIAFMSDIHADSPDADLVSFKRDLAICKKEGRSIVFGGDMFDAIIHTDQKRFTPSRSDNNRDDQINVKIDLMFILLKDYADNIIFMGRGNHEESILKYSGVNMIDLLIKQLNHYKTNGEIIEGNYQNFIRFDFLDGRGKSMAHYDILQHHGAGASAPVTKGAIDFNRIIHGANVDLVVLGHKHHSNFLGSDPIMYIDNNGEVKIKNRQAIMTPSYAKGRSIDYNVNFAERFYTHQSLSGFASLDLTPAYDGDKPLLKSDITMRINSYAKIGDLQNISLKKKAENKTNTR